MKILIFLHGTTIMHRNAANVPRKERIQQVVDNEESVCDFATYVPIGQAAEKIRNWKQKGAEIIYLSSHLSREDVEKDRSVLNKYAFPEGDVLWRRGGKDYGDVAEELMPDILIEDDCESIGGAENMTITHITPERKRLIKSIVVPEFAGIDNLPDAITGLLEYQTQN